MSYLDLEYGKYVLIMALRSSGVPSFYRLKYVGLHRESQESLMTVMEET